jgi:DNA-binding transcriptional ArsR family regulator
MRDDGNEPVNIDAIEINLTAGMVCSNLNRLCILYLLKKMPNNEMQAEKIASNLGISHRTVLYHLDILRDYELVEVREFRKKGAKFLRSVWGLNAGNERSLKKVFTNIGKKLDLQKLDKFIMVEGNSMYQRKK